MAIFVQQPSIFDNPELTLCKILTREIWERIQLIDISNVWQLQSNYLKRAKSEQKGVMKEMITGSISLSFSFFLPCPPFLVPFTGWTNIHEVVDDDDDDDYDVQVNASTS